MFRISSLLISVLTMLLVSCGGGEAAVTPKIETLGFEGSWVKVRLTFSGSEGFSQPVAPGDEVVWHSGMVSGIQPTAPRAKVERAAGGGLSAEVTLYYTTDRGVFGITSSGQTLSITGGNPTNSMVVRNWQLPETMKPVDLSDGTGRVWLDVSF